MLVSLQRLGKLIISRMLQYYTEPRVIRLTGRDDLKSVWPTYVRFFVEQNETPDGTTYRPVSQRITHDDATDTYVEGESVEGDYTVGDFELDITSGTSLPFIKEQRSQQALRLFESQAIDQQALLDVLDFPEKDAIMQRMAEASANQPPPDGAMPGAM